MMICDDYLALRALLAGRPAEMPDTGALGVTTSTWWRLLRPVHGVIHARATGTTQGVEGSFTAVMNTMPDEVLNRVRQPDARLLQVLDSRRILDTAAALGVSHRGGMLQLETIAAAVVYSGTLWYGSERNISPVTKRIAADLDIDIHVVTARN